MTWEVRQAPNDPNAWDVYDGAGKVAHLPWCSKANAHLIAAAPELHEVLRRFVDCREAHGSGGACSEDHVELVLDADRVLAKAGGQ